MKGWVDFRAVKQAVTMEAVLRHYQVTGVRRHREQLQGPCPIHRGKRDDSFRASLSKNVIVLLIRGDLVKPHVDSGRVPQSSG